MEIIVRIKEQGVLKEREFTNRDGVAEKFASVPFVLTHGSDVFFAEMVQDVARKAGTLSKDYYYVASLSCTAREWTDKNNETRYENRFILNKLSIL